MTTQIRNAAMVNLLRADYQARYEPQFALAQVMSNMMALPGLRGFWPMSAIDSSGNAFDQSGNGRTLTYNGNPTYNYDDLAPYIALDGTGDYLSRADEAGLDIIGTETYVANPGLTLGGWFYMTTAVGTTEYLFSKDNNATQRSYAFRRDAIAVGRFFVSNTGAAIVQAGGLDTVINSDAWYFVAGRFVPSTSVTSFVNGVFNTNTTSIPASIFNSTSALVIGGQSGGLNLMAGRASLCFLCAAALSDAIISNLWQQSRALFGV